VSSAYWRMRSPFSIQMRSTTLITLARKNSVVPECFPNRGDSGWIRTQFRSLLTIQWRRMLAWYRTDQTWERRRWLAL
jgi:hypothetical protein